MRHPILSKHLGAITFGVCAAIVLAACSGSSTPSSKASTATTANSGSTSSVGVGGGSSTTAAKAAPSCGLVPASQVNSALGVNVGSPASTVNGSVTVCTYSGTPGQVIIRFQTGEDAATFAAGKAGFTTNGETTTDVSGLGQAAYSSTVGSGQFQTNTIVVLDGNLELLVTAPVSQEDVNALARQILLSI